jgi:hypothetical protein
MYLRVIKAAPPRVFQFSVLSDLGPVALLMSKAGVYLNGTASPAHWVYTVLFSDSDDDQILIAGQIASEDSLYQ